MMITVYIQRGDVYATGKVSVMSRRFLLNFLHGKPSFSMYYILQMLYFPDSVQNRLHFKQSSEHAGSCLWPINWCIVSVNAITTMQTHLVMGVFLCTVLVLNLCFPTYFNMTEI